MIHRVSSGSDTMPVRAGEWCLDDVDVHGTFADLGHPYFQLESTLAIGVAAEFYASTPVPSDDIWKKFDLPELSSTWSSSSMTDDDSELDSILEEYASATVTSSSMWTALDKSSSSATGKEIRHHDCMWAGHCINKEHNRTLKLLQFQQQTSSSPTKAISVLKKNSEIVTVTQTPRVTVCKNIRTGGKSTVSSSSCQSSVLNSLKNDVCVVKTSGRSLLLTSRTTNGGKVSSSPRVPFHRASLESDGDSPRPETPQSLSESEEDMDDHPRFKHSLELVVSSSVAGTCDTPSGFLAPSLDESDKVRDAVDYDTCGELDDDDDDDDDEDADSSMAVSISEVTGQICRPLTDSSSSDSDSVATSTSTDAYYNDHSYHISKTNVRMDNLGVQTPSDSEEEIDVVSVGEKAPASRVGVTLPTNPSPHDCQQLQLTMASAMNARGRKRSASNSLTRATKRARHQYHHRLPHQKPGRRPAASSSDSEPDSCEKRSLHNNMERQRRVDLRNLVEGLRVMVPEVEGKKRAAKVVILREAAGYCHRLREHSRGLVASVAALRREQERLRARVSQLRRSLAANR